MRQADGSVRTPAADGHRARLRAAAGAALLTVAGAVGYVAWDSGDDAILAWVAVTRVPTGTAATEAAFQQQAVSLPHPDVLYPAGAPPAGVATRTIEAGQPLFAADVVADAEPDGRAVTLTLPPERLPGALEPGDVVDVWAARGGAQATQLLAEVPVGTVLAGTELTGQAQVELLVPDGSAQQAVTAALADDIVLVRRP